MLISRLHPIHFFLCLIVSLLFSSSGFAQVTSSSLRGSVVNASGEVIENVELRLEHSPSQTSKTTSSNANGEFAFHGLRVGGPYVLTAVHPEMGHAEQQSIFLQAGQNSINAIRLQPSERIAVVGSRQVAVGRRQAFGEEDIDRAPSIGGDLKDVVRQSIDAYVDGTRLSIGGANNRFNSITVDGIRQDDDFGLNANGYPTQRSPISLQSVAEISVNRSPFDVRYSNFLGGNINVVTKSGGNDYEGSVLLSFGSEDLQGRKIKDQSFKPDFEETRLGLALGGPIQRDRLHFFLNAEFLEGRTPNIAGPAGSGKPVETSRVSQEDLARVQEISNRVYGFNAGSPGRSLSEDDLKFLAKLDWTINDDHRLEMKYQRSTGSNINSGPANERQLSLTSNWYEKRDTLDTVSLRLFSDWSYLWSTKLEVSQKQVVTSQEPLEGNGFMAAEIHTPDDGRLLIGPDRFRHANEMDNNSSFVSFESNYLWGEHHLTKGIEYNKVDIFNLFVPTSNGFAIYRSIEDFEARRASDLTYQNAISHNPRDAAADWWYAVTSFYLQDSFDLTPNLSARIGVRGELYDASQNIERNERFVERHGFDNTATVAGKMVWLPRMELGYQASNRLSFSGGIGLYSGGTPNVWLSNSYTNTGVAIDTKTIRDHEGFDGRNIPSEVRDLLQAGDGNVDALDPNFEIPQTWKFALGSNLLFDIPSVTDNVLLELDYNFSRTRYALSWQDLRRNLDSIPNNNPIATGPDGRALYSTDPTVGGAGNFNTLRGYDLMLTNTDQGYGHTASMSLSKRFATGWNLSAAYGWQRIFEVHPGTSSTSSSNYGLVPIKDDPNNPGLDPSIYERTHRFVVSTGYSRAWLAGLESSFQLFMERHSGQRYSYTFGGDRDQVGRLFGEARDFASRERMLFYVPRGDGSDVILDGIDEEEFNAFLKESGLDRYRGKIAPRNAFTGSWVDRIDLRLAQQVPSFRNNHRARFMVDVRNLPNLLNNRWGQIKQSSFPYFTRVVDVGYDEATGRYIYSNLNRNGAENVRLASSVWRIQLTAMYEF